MHNPAHLSFFREGHPATGLGDQGFRLGDKGTHTSRTMMLTEITALMAAARNGADRATFAASIVGDNCLGKKTEATRRLTNQRLGELYALDPAVGLFRVFRRLWGADDDSQPLLALLISIARDPLLMATAKPILHTPESSEFRRSECRSALKEATGDRINDAVLDKVLRNTARPSFPC